MNYNDDTNLNAVISNLTATLDHIVCDHMPSGNLKKVDVQFFKEMDVNLFQSHTGS